MCSSPVSGSRRNRATRYPGYNHGDDDDDNNKSLSRHFDDSYSEVDTDFSKSVDGDTALTNANSNKPLLNGLNAKTDKDGNTYYSPEAGLRIRDGMVTKDTDKPQAQTEKDSLGSHRIINLVHEVLATPKSGRTNRNRQKETNTGHDAKIPQYKKITPTLQTNTLIETPRRLTTAQFNFKHFPRALNFTNHLPFKNGRTVSNNPRYKNTEEFNPIPYENDSKISAPFPHHREKRDRLSLPKRRNNKNRIDKRVSGPSKKNVDLWILGLFPMTGLWPGGQGQLPAVEMGIEDVNNDPTMLPGYTLKLQLNNTNVSS